MTDDTIHLKRIADALETMASIAKSNEEERKQVIEEHKLMLTGDWKSERLSLSKGTQQCVYCDTREVRMVLRGNKVFGCVECIWECVEFKGG